MAAKRKNDARTNYRKKADDAITAAMRAICLACDDLGKLEQQRDEPYHAGPCHKAIKMLDKAHDLVVKARKTAYTAEVYIDPKTGLYKIR